MQVIFVPGMQCTGQLFGDVSAALQARFPNILVSNHVVKESRLEAAATSLAGKMDGPSILVGHSLGGTVAMAAARMYPFSVAGLALICSNPRPPRTDQVGLWGEMSRQVLDGQLSSISQGLVPKLLDGQIWDTSLAATEAAEMCHRMMAEIGDHGLAAQLGVQRQRIDERLALAEFFGPVLAVAAARDSLVPVHVVKEIAMNARQGEFATVSGASHMLPMTEPVQLTSLLTQWISTNFDPKLAAAGNNID